ncbi:MAG: S8 family serine peptidase, partial [Bacteroidales bacterium]|nr:S8 family serine peptidase [Bacteroidales bacterium]
MKHYIVYLFIFVFLGNLSAQPSRRVEAGKVIVKLKPDAVPAVETKLRTLSRTLSDTSVLSTGIKSFDRINRRYRASNMRRVFPDAGKYEAKHREYGLHLWYEITIPEGEDPETVAVGYGIDGNVQVAEPRYKIRRLGMPASPLPPVETPNDPDFGKQWNYNNTGQTGGKQGADIRLTDAWERIKSLGIKNSNVIVAVVDGGVYDDHEDLKANMWINEAELNGVRNVDDDGNRYVDDIYGYNFVKGSGAISPEDHATHVAGTIAAVTGNSVGVSGIAGNPGEGYGIKIMTVQIFDGERSVSSIGDAYAYAADNGAVILQNSWGYEEAGKYNESDIAAINYFIREAGRDENKKPRPGTPMTGGIVIFAAGNDGKDNKWYPAYFDNVLAVAATNHYGKLAWYSNFGRWV